MTTSGGQYNLSDVLTRCGVTVRETVPFSAPCPLCQTATGLEVRSRHNLVCGHCGFIGDALELFAAVSKQPLVAAVALLVTEHELSFDEYEEGTYLNGRRENSEVIELWRAGTRLIEDGMSSSIQTILQELKCYQHQNDRKRWSTVFGSYRKEDLLEMAQYYGARVGRKRTSTAEAIARSIGKYSVIGIPCWQESRLVGMWLIHPRAIDNGHVYIPFSEVSNSVGLAHLTRGTDDEIIVTSDPRIALRYTIRQMWEGGSKTSPFTPFVCPGPYIEKRVMDTGARNVLYFPVEIPMTDISLWFASALRSVGSQTIMSWKMTESPMAEFPKGTAAVMLAGLRNQAVPSHQALGSYLLAQPLSEGGKLARVLELSTADQNLVRSFFTGDDGATIDRLFDSTARPRQIDYNGKRVIETKKGWLCRDVMISNILIHITQSETDQITGKTTITGTLASEGKLCHFREDLAVLRKDFGTWLNTIARSKLLIWPKIEVTWTRHLLDIAYEFSRETARIVTSDRPFGWDTRGVLRFPRFYIDQTDIHMVQCTVFGPNVVPPTDMTANEFDALSDLGFCLISLALLGNIMRTHAGLHGLGIIVPSSPHVIARLGDALGMPMVKNPTIQEVMVGEMRPLPLVASWDDAHLNELLKTRGPKNILTSIDSRSFKLMTPLPDWIRLDISNLANYDEIRWIYHAIPRLLKAPVSLSDRLFFTNLARTLSTWIGAHNGTSKLLAAASDLDDSVVSVDKGSAGNRIVYMLRQLHMEGALRAENTGSAEITILHTDVIAAMASPILPPPNIAAMTVGLADSGMLLKSDRTKWVISDSLWGLVGSYLKTKS